ncbi:hypothetical protein F5887DRAFT_887768, partial [Amanita rubescens]
KLKLCLCINTYGEFTSFDSSNQYFSSIKDCSPMEKHIPFGRDINPYGILSGIENTGYIHVTDNLVNYYEQSTLEMGEMKYMEISPVRFQNGDIVEAQVMFTLVSLPGVTSRFWLRWNRTPKCTAFRVSASHHASRKLPKSNLRADDLQQHFTLPHMSLWTPGLLRTPQDSL